MLPGFTAQAALDQPSGVYALTPRRGRRQDFGLVRPQAALQRQRGGTTVSSYSCCCGSGSQRRCSAPMACPYPRCSFNCVCGDGYMTAHCRCWNRAAAGVA